MMRFSGVVTAAAVLLTGGSASAQIAVAPPPYTLLVWGEATVAAAPDSAQIDIAVTSRADTARQAAASNSALAARVIGELKKITGAATVTTAAYSIRPDYRYPKPGAEPQIAGYTATNVVRVDTSMLDEIGRILDAAVAAGATRIQRLEFMLKNEHAAYADALRQAATRARVEADALAAALGVKVTRVLTATEEPTTEAPPPRPFATAALAEADAPTPIESGTIDVRARVRLTVEFSGRAAP